MFGISILFRYMFEILSNKKKIINILNNNYDLICVKHEDVYNIHELQNKLKKSLTIQNDGYNYFIKFYLNKMF